MKRIVFRGDDAGGSFTANDAICRCLKAGILKNVGIMAPCYAFDDAIEKLAEFNACFGVHATLNAEWDKVKWGPVLPPSEVPSLVDDDGNLKSSPCLFEVEGVNYDQVLAELKAQIDKVRATGLPIKYFDEHMGFAYLPGLRERIQELCDQEQLIYNMYLGFLGWNGPIEQRIEAVPRGDYLAVFHPGGYTDEMLGMSHEGYPGERVATERQADTDLLCSVDLPEILRRQNAVSIRFDEVLR